MYIVLGVLMLIRGFVDAIMMRSQQSMAVGAAPGYLAPEHYNQIFSAHGTIMIFFVAMPLVIGFMNFVVPLQLGVRDVAFPTMNNVSFWLTGSGALLVNISLSSANSREPAGYRGFRRSAKRILARRRRRLLPRGVTDIRGRHTADRRKLRHHDPEDPRSRHELPAHADILLDDLASTCSSSPSSRC